MPAARPLVVDEKAAAESLSAAIRARTVSSYDDAQLNADQFAALHAHLAQRYPRVHAALKREVVGGLSLLYSWEGGDPKALPIALMAHQDVVPVATGTESDWQADPFGGAIKAFGKTKAGKWSTRISFNVRLKVKIEEQPA